MQSNSNLTPNLSDEELVSRVVSRDVEAFSTLYDRHSQMVYALAAHMMGRTEAEDIVQEVFLVLWNKAHQYTPERGAFSSWFVAIARNKVVDRLARLGKEKGITAAEGINRLLDGLPDDSEGVEDQVWLKDSANEALQAMSSIPEEQRRVLVLAYFGGLSQSAIAEHLNIPLGTVKKRIRLGLQKLRVSLKQGAGQDGFNGSKVDADGVRHGL